MSQNEPKDLRNSNEKSFFDKFKILIIALLIFTMIVYRFFLIEPKAEINTGIITLIAFLLIIILSDTFDSFSIGEIIKLSKTIKNKEDIIEKKEEELVRIESEKNQLLGQIINLSNNISLKQNNTNILGINTDLYKNIGVQKANEEEVNDLKNKEEDEIEKDETSKRRRIDNSKLEEFVLKQFFVEHNIDISKIFKGIKLQAFQGIDPISDTSPIFDAYLNDIDKEVFYEVRPIKNYLTGMFLDKLYSMLSKIYHYRNVKKNNTFLNLILVEFPGEGISENILMNKILDIFQPALSKGLLKISVIKLDENEMTPLYQN
jgi:hypothetical protein